MCRDQSNSINLQEFDWSVFEGKTEDEIIDFLVELYLDRADNGIDSVDTPMFPILRVLEHVGLIENSSITAERFIRARDAKWHEEYDYSIYDYSTPEISNCRCRNRFLNIHFPS
jgi:hypothetical protein